jgi:hypothetical protein
MTGPQARNHEIDKTTAAAITQRHRRQVTGQGARPVGEGELGGMFTRESILKLLEQPNARYLRFYYGRGERGGRELVLVAADAAGDDITETEGALILDGHFPCPPFCPTTDSALRGQE